MRSVYVYNPFWSTFGGGEKYTLALAEVLSQLPEISVTLLSTNSLVHKADLEAFSHINLGTINYRVCPSLAKLKQITRDVEIFICLSNVRRVESLAQRHVQLLQIPYGEISAASIFGGILWGKLGHVAKDLYRTKLLSFARSDVDLVITNSKFVSDTLLRNFGIKSCVLYPPIQDFFHEGFSRKRVVLSVGRFFGRLYNDKRYDVLTEAFRRVSRSDLQGWEYHIVGNASTDPATEKMLSSLREKNKGYPVYFHVNCAFEVLHQLYNEATIFWHAAGYEVNEELHPENVEHFGMTTVEAMSAGCIPVVIKKGGQKEIILDGVNGFSWSTIDELISRSVEIARGDVPLAEMRQNARKRFEDFSVDRFRERVVELFSPFFS
ncbi:MAG: glycosyltransferase family 4 protein [Bacteroidota bacterium]